MAKPWSGLVRAVSKALSFLQVPGCPLLTCPIDSLCDCRTPTALSRLPPGTAGTLWRSYSAESGACAFSLLRVEQQNADALLQTLPHLALEAARRASANELNKN